MKLEIEMPKIDTLHNLCPRAQGRIAPWIGEYGYAVAVTGDGRIRIVWDEGNWDDVLPDEVVLRWG